LEKLDAYFQKNFEFSAAYDLEDYSILEGTDFETPE